MPRFPCLSLNLLLFFCSIKPCHTCICSQALHFQHLYLFPWLKFVVSFRSSASQPNTNPLAFPFFGHNREISLLTPLIALKILVSPTLHPFCLNVHSHASSESSLPIVFHNSELYVYQRLVYLYPCYISSVSSVCSLSCSSSASFYHVPTKIM